MRQQSGYFEIGIVGGKMPENLGTLWRSAYQLGASGIFMVGRRFKRLPADTTKTWRHVPLREYADVEDLLSHRPYDCLLVGIETDGRSLGQFTHPKRALYVLGAEDNGLSKPLADRCQQIVSIESIRTQSYNVAVAGSLVMYDRLIKQISSAFRG